MSVLSELRESVRGSQGVSTVSIDSRDFSALVFISGIVGNSWLGEGENAIEYDQSERMVEYLKDAQIRKRHKDYGVIRCANLAVEGGG